MAQTSIDATQIAKNVNPANLMSAAQARSMIAFETPPEIAAANLDAVLGHCSPAQGPAVLSAFAPGWLNGPPESDVPLLRDVVARTVEAGALTPARLAELEGAAEQLPEGSHSIATLVASLPNSDRTLSAKDAVIDRQLADAKALAAVPGDDYAARTAHAQAAQLDRQASLILASEPPERALARLAAMPAADRTAFVQGALEGEARNAGAPPPLHLSGSGIETLMRAAAASNGPNAVRVSADLFADATDVVRKGGGYENSRNDAGAVDTTRAGLKALDGPGGNGFASALNDVADRGLRTYLSRDMTAGDAGFRGIGGVEAYVSFEAQSRPSDAERALSVMGRQIGRLAGVAAADPKDEAGVVQVNDDLGPGIGRVRSGQIAGQLAGAVQGSLSNVQGSIESRAKDAQAFDKGISTGLGDALALAAGPEVLGAKALISPATKATIGLLRSGFDTAALATPETRQVRELRDHFKTTVDTLHDLLPGEAQRAFEGAHGSQGFQTRDHAQNAPRTPGAPANLDAVQLAALQRGVAEASLPAPLQVVNYAGAAQTGTPFKVGDDIVLSAGRGRYVLVEPSAVTPEVFAKLSDAAERRQLVDMQHGGAAVDVADRGASLSRST